MSQRKAFIENLKCKLDGWNAEIERLQSKADKIEAPNRARYSAAMQDIIGKIQKLEKNLIMIENSTTDAWLNIKSGLEIRKKTLEERIKHARDIFP
ncbi:MAG: hypothetical protein PVG51_02045 [Desulfosarcina sp.]|jgi:hypothetical protein